MFEESATDRLDRKSYIHTNLVAGILGRDVERICETENLTEAHFRVLWVLCRESAPTGRAMGDIADGLINRAADLTRLVDKLERLSLVVRARPKHDRRSVVVRVTPKGRRVFERLHERIRNLHVEQWSGLTRTEQRQLVALLAKVLRTQAHDEVTNSWLMGSTA
jgi:DNA-binding MarR family transcriptional regulator